MAHIVADRVKETTSTTGTGSLTLTGAVAGFKTIASRLTVDGDTGWFCAVNGSEWEVFLGTRSSSSVLARTAVLASSNADAAVNFSAAPTVFATVPGAKIALNGPAFCAYRASSNQSVTTATVTKVQLNGEDFDTDGCFDSTTNYRFTPNVPGYYQIEFCLYSSCSSGMTVSDPTVKKNGSIIAHGSYSPPLGQESISTGSKLVYMNGTTDYLELFAYISGSSPVVRYGLDQTYFCGHFVRP